MRKIFNEDQINYIINHYKDMPYVEIASTLGFTERQIRGKINGMGLTKNRQFDKAYFNRVDTPEKAYWLGLFYADGYVVIGNDLSTYEVAMELNSGDGYILEEFVKAIGGTHEIKYEHKEKVIEGIHCETDSAILRVYSKQLACDLVCQGVVQRKTYSDTFPRVDDNFRDFVRGYFDGDGCIYINSHKNNLPVISFTCACIEFLQYLKAGIESELGIVGSIYTENELKHKLVYFRKEDVLRIIDWLYYDDSIPALERKRTKSLYAFGLAAS